MGFLYGLVISRIPAPSDPLALSAGYFVAPWLVLPFLAGWLQRSALWATAAGVVTEVLCMFRFYLNAFPEYHPAYIVLKETASGFDLVLGSAVLWVGVNAMWYVIAVVAGIALAQLGRWLRITGSPVPVIVLGTFFILEPSAHLLLGGSIPRPYVVWVLEVVAGVALMAWTVAVHKRRQAGFAQGSSTV